MRAPKSRRLAALATVLVLLAAPAFAADLSKTLRVAFPVGETGFDPAPVGDIYSQYVNRAIFDTLYKYDYLARPYKIVPNTATSLPEISADGKTWTIKIKPGIYFADDPAFKGKKRELTAADYVYSWKRIIDPKMRSNNLQIFDRKILGADAVLAAAKENGKFDYDAPMEGLQAIDRHTIRLQLNFPSYDLMAELTTASTAAVAREIIEAYGDENGWTMANPVGTGPYRLKEWRRGQKIVLEANPGFRDETFPESSAPEDRALVAKMRGKKLPIIGRIEISIIEESNPRLLAFQNRELDYLTVPSDLVANVLVPDNKLKPELAKQGIVHARGVQPAISYTYFNMEDPVVGGYTKEKIALRRAISMAYNVDEEIRVLRQGQAEPATQPIPPSVAGYDPKIKGNARHDVAGAKALLDRFGYVDRDGDGWRDLPDGKPLKVMIGSDPSALNRQYDELWQRSLTAVGIRVEFMKQKWPDLLKMARYGQLQMWFLGNINTTPEGFGFMSLLYGPHSGFANLSRFNLPEFNQLYERAQKLPDGAERTQLFRKMSELVNAYAPWLLNAYRYENVLVQPWVLGYKHTVFDWHPWKYYDIDAGRRNVAGK
ncbi:MAG TPA: ABC transporter substrate-binding protein [Casimicrobiaceae bacterium]|jgi:ABC-type transport system substrate-binding protein|nr:ABC transporter substrate-binding protein [Casimicrobiaceae bacterium]